MIVPALNAAAALSECLKRVEAADEIIVVDGGSQDGTWQIARQAGAKLIKTPRGRGVQLREGAAVATGEWLLFLHADTLLADGWQEAVLEHIAVHPSDAAYFTFLLDDASWQARLLERGVALRSRILALPYGDQGLLISRRHYQALGGFRPLPLMEDVDLIRRIGRRRLRRLDVAAVTSAERWRRDGWWRRSARNLFCLALYSLGVEPSRIARLYG